MFAAMRNGSILIASVWLFLGAASYIVRDVNVRVLIVLFIVAVILTTFVLFDLLISMDVIRKNKKQ